jgi:hypothetical protein
VPAGKGEPPHEHGDIRYALATAHPEAAVPENRKAQLVWLNVADAMQKVGADNLRTCLERIQALFTGH